MHYYVIETQTRTDGEVNTSITGRSTYALTLSYYYERCSKGVANETFPSISVAFVDENLNQLKHETLETSYVEPEPTE